MIIIMLPVIGKEITLVPNLNLIIMAQMIVTLKRVQVFESENSSNVNLVINEAIDGFKRVINDGTVEYVEDKVNTISIGRSALTAMLCDVNDDIAMYRCTIDHAFGQREFGLILSGATLTIERTLHSAGEVYTQAEDGTDIAYQRDCYTTEIVDVKLSARSQSILDKALTL
jgi:hypothetical protein